MVINLSAGRHLFNQGLKFVLITLILIGSASLIIYFKFSGTYLAAIGAIFCFQQFSMIAQMKKTGTARIIGEKLYIKRLFHREIVLKIFDVERMDSIQKGRKQELIIEFYLNEKLHKVRLPKRTRELDQSDPEQILLYSRNYYRSMALKN